MKPTLQLKLGQQLTMTPQLQQAIRLLQLSTLDLQQEIQQALENNPMLEVEEDQGLATNSSEGERHESGEDPDGAEAQAAAESSGAEGDEYAAEGDWSESIPSDLSVDSNWDAVYPTAGVASGPGGDGDDYDFDGRNGTTETLQDYLNWQLNLTPMSDVDRLIAMNIIDGVTPDGMLTTLLDDVRVSLERDDIQVELDEIEAVLHRIQQFDPVGVAARSVDECLLIQLRQLPVDTPWRREAEVVLAEHMGLLGSRDYTQLMRRMRLKQDQLAEVLQLIQGLNPRPGASVSTAQPEYVIPDVFVRKVQGQWAVDLNPDIAPKLRVNEGYASLVRRADNGADNQYLRSNLQEARWFLKSLASRNDTLLKVAREIVRVQQGFLEHGEEAMKPLVLHDIAEAVEMHESTISRVTTQKYMHTPRGVFELKYFFSSHVGTDTGGECSSTAIRAIIRKLIGAENPRKPLSDSKITAVLAEQGIQVARRTIAKYRESMDIPPSNERKQLL